MILFALRSWSWFFLSFFFFFFFFFFVRMVIVKLKKPYYLEGHEGSMGSLKYRPEITQRENFLSTPKLCQYWLLGWQQQLW